MLLENRTPGFPLQETGITEPQLSQPDFTSGSATGEPCGLWARSFSREPQGFLYQTGW